MERGLSETQWWFQLAQKGPWERWKVGEQFVLLREVTRSPSASPKDTEWSASRRVRPSREKALGPRSLGSWPCILHCLAHCSLFSQRTWELATGPTYCGLTSEQLQKQAAAPTWGRTWADMACVIMASFLLWHVLKFLWLTRPWHIWMSLVLDTLMLFPLNHEWDCGDCEK